MHTFGFVLQQRVVDLASHLWVSRDCSTMEVALQLFGTSGEGRIFFLEPRSTRLCGRAARRCLPFLAHPSLCAIAQGDGLGATGSLGQWALRPFPCEAIGQPLLSDAPCFRTLLSFGYCTLVQKEKHQACSSLWYGTWDAPALVPNWSSFIFVVVVVVSVERSLFSVSVFVGGHYWSALRGVVLWAPPPAGAYCC